VNPECGGALTGSALDFRICNAIGANNANSLYFPPARGAMDGIVRDIVIFQTATAMKAWAVGC
jgi:hypothetical protein